MVALWPSLLTINVSDKKSTAPTIPIAASPVCSQKMTRHDVYVTIIPPRRGPMVGPIRVPYKTNQEPWHAVLDGKGHQSPLGQ